MNRAKRNESNITSKKTSLYIVKLLFNQFSRSRNSFLEAKAASLILEKKGIDSNTDDRICKTNKKKGSETEITVKTTIPNPRDWHPKHKIADISQKVQ